MKFTVKPFKKFELTPTTMIHIPIRGYFCFPCSLQSNFKYYVKCVGLACKGCLTGLLMSQYCENNIDYDRQKNII